MPSGLSWCHEYGLFPRRLLPRLLLVAVGLLVIAEKVFSRGHLFGKMGGMVKLALATFILSESLFS